MQELSSHSQEVTPSHFMETNVLIFELDVRIRQNGDEGRPIVHADPENPVSASFREVASKVAARISKINKRKATTISNKYVFCSSVE